MDITELENSNIPHSAQIDLQTHVFCGWKLISYPCTLRDITELETVISLKVHKSIYRRMFCGWKLISNPCTLRDITELESTYGTFNRSKK